jgi:hypothetical protein
MTEKTHGASYTTDTVHYATRVQGRLVQDCGMGRRQRASLYETDAPVTCLRCLGTK